MSQYAGDDQEDGVKRSAADTERSDASGSRNMFAEHAHDRVRDQEFAAQTPGLIRADVAAPKAPLHEGEQERAFERGLVELRRMPGHGQLPQARSRSLFGKITAHATVVTLPDKLAVDEIRDPAEK